MRCGGLILTWLTSAWQVQNGNNWIVIEISVYRNQSTKLQDTPITHNVKVNATEHNALVVLISIHPSPPQ